MKIKEELNKKIEKKVGPLGVVIFPIIGAVIIVAAAVAYICLKIADEMRYNEKWKDYDECGMN